MMGMLMGMGTNSASEHISQGLPSLLAADYSNYISRYSDTRLYTSVSDFAKLIRARLILSFLICLFVQLIWNYGCKHIVNKANIIWRQTAYNDIFWI